jgi:hypothetical protein
MTMLDPDVLIEKAQQFVRADDLLGDAWQVGFRLLLRAIEAEARPRPKRVEQAAREMIGLLVTRARLASLLRERPEIAAIEVPAPLVITGLPRSGTTFLHHLSARVPGNRGYRLWELRAPAFARSAPVDQAKREVTTTNEALAWLYEQAPRMRTIHPVDANLPDECNWLLRPTFTTPVFAWSNYVPSYDRYLAEVDWVPAYREWQLQLQAIRWRSPGGWPVLKDPGHLWALPALFEVQPQARVVVLVRELGESVASLCSLCAALQEMQADPPDRHAIGRYVLGMVERGLASLARARAQRPENFLFVNYRELVAEPVGVVRTIQQWAGRPFDGLAEQRIAIFLRAQSRERKEPHVYNLGEYGLTITDLPAAIE